MCVSVWLCACVGRCVYFDMIVTICVCVFVCACVRSTHSRGGGGALQCGGIGRLQLPCHHQLRAAEELVKVVLGDFRDRFLLKLDGDLPQEGGGHLAVEALEARREGGAEGWGGREEQRGEQERATLGCGEDVRH